MAVKMSFGGASAETSGFQLYMGETSDSGEDQHFVVASSLQEAHEQYRAAVSMYEGSSYRVWEVKGSSIAGPARSLIWHSEVVAEGDWTVYDE